MLWCSIDLETTGLDAQNDQVLEIGVIIDDTDPNKWLDLDDLPRKRIIVAHDKIIGDPFALSLNSELIAEIANGNGVSEESALYELFGWLYKYFSRNGKINIGGKNVSGFDLPFLRKMSINNKLRTMDDPAVSIDLFHRRIIDPAIFYMRPDDTELPNLSTCLSRIGFEPSDLHTSLGDALDVIKLVRHAIKENKIE